MALLDHNNLGDERDWGRAFTVLSAITHGYVWQNGGNNPAKVIQEKYINYFNSYTDIVYK
jgi:hypothetical protein